MTLDKRTREEMLAHCLQIHPDDGIDPRELSKPSRHQAKRDRKTDQLCRQVFETLSLVLSGELDDERLHNLQLLSVAPAPDASQLLVLLGCDPQCSIDTMNQLQVRLQAVSGRLRCEVATAITRKRAPKLLLQVVKLSHGEAQP